MVNKSGMKGTSHETNIVNYLQSKLWPYAKRLRLSGKNDKGDISLGDGIAVVIEAKNEKAITLGSYIKEVETETVNANAEVGVAWVKRPGKSSPGEHYVVMTGDTFVLLLEKAGYVPK